MKVLPQASATGNIHIGTIAGKLNGVMPGDDAQRLPHRIAVDAGAHLLGELALQQLRNAGRELDHLDAALHLAGWRPRATLPCSEVMIAASRVRSRSSSSRKRLRMRARRSGGAAAHCGKRRRGGLDRRIDVGLAAERDPARDCSGGRVEHLTVPSGCAFDRRPPMKWGTTGSDVAESTGLSIAELFNPDIVL